MRLYVLVLSSLELPHKAVQGGHALAQWMMENPAQGWNNETLIYLSCDDLEAQLRALERKGIRYSRFCEPDRDNQLTAIAVLGHRNEFRSLKLIE